MTQIQRFKYLEFSGSPDMNIDASLAPVEFLLPFTDNNMDIRSLNIELESGGRLVRTDRFMTLDDPLVNGLQLVVQSQGVVFEPVPIRTTNGLLSVCDKDARLEETLHDTTVSFRGRITIAPQGIIISQSRSDFIKLILNDDFSLLSYFRFGVWGIAV